MLPEKINVSLDEISGNSCGELSHQYDLDENSDPPKYNYVPSGGNFMSGSLTAIKDGNGDIVDWQLIIVYFNFGHSCHGLHTFRQSSPGDDPIGDYCLWNGSSVNCSNGKATVEEDC